MHTGYAIGESSLRWGTGPAAPSSSRRTTPRASSQRRGTQAPPPRRPRIAASHLPHCTYTVCLMAMHRQRVPRGVGITCIYMEWEMPFASEIMIFWLVPSGTGALCRALVVLKRPYPCPPPPRRMYAALQWQRPARRPPPPTSTRHIHAHARQRRWHAHVYMHVPAVYNNTNTANCTASSHSSPTNSGSMHARPKRMQNGPSCPHPAPRHPPAPPAAWPACLHEGGLPKPAWARPGRPPVAGFSPPPPVCGACNCDGPPPVFGAGACAHSAQQQQCPPITLSARGARMLH